MKNAEIWDQYVRYTRDVTEISRKLGFGAIAVIWVLKHPDGTFPGNLYYSMGLVVGFFATDILQSLTAAVFLRTWIHNEEQKRYSQSGKIEGEYSKPRWLDYPAFGLFLIKVILLLFAFAMIGVELYLRWVA